MPNILLFYVTAADGGTGLENCVDGEQMPLGP